MSVFTIKQDNSGWDAADKGRSKLLIMYSPATHTTRVIAQCETDRKWVLNVFATPSVQVSYLTELFVDWQDSKNHYGLGFDDKELAVKFVTTIEERAGRLSEDGPLEEPATHIIVYDSVYNAHKSDRKSVV